MISKSWQPGPLEERPPPEVRERLLRCGGRDASRMKGGGACIPREQLDEMLLKNGAPMDSKGAVFWEREPSQHHSNIFELWREHWWGISEDAPLVETRGVCFGVRFKGASADTVVDCFLGDQPDSQDPDVAR